MGNSVFQMLDFCSWNSQNHHDLTSLVMTRSDVYGFGIPWVLTEIWRYLGCVCHVISPNSYRISLILRRLLGYKNTSGKKGVQSVCGSSGCSVSAPALGAWPLVSVALCPPLAAAVPGLAALRAPSPAPQLSASQRQLCLPDFSFGQYQEVLSACHSRSQRDALVEVGQLPLPSCF